MTSLIGTDAISKDNKEQQSCAHITVLVGIYSLKNSSEELRCLEPTVIICAFRLRILY